MGYSYQDIDTRLRVIEDKVEFVMKAFNVSQPSPIVGAPSTMKSLLQVYYEVKAGVSLANAVNTGGVPVEEPLEGEITADECVDESQRGSEVAG